MLCERHVNVIQFVKAKKSDRRASRKKEQYLKLITSNILLLLSRKRNEESGKMKFRCFAQWMKTQRPILFDFYTEHNLDTMKLILESCFHVSRSLNSFSALDTSVMIERHVHE